MIKFIRQTVCFQSLGYLFQLGAFFIFAKILGTEGQGVLSIFRALGQIIASIMWMGLPASIVYFIGKDKCLFFPLLRNCLKWFAFAFFLLVLCLYLVPIKKTPKLNLVESYIPHLLFFVFLSSFFDLFQGLMLSLKKYLYYNLFAFGLGAAIFSFSVLTGVLPRSYDKLTFAIVFYVLGYGLVFFYGVVMVFFEGYKLIKENEAGKKVPFLYQFTVGFRGFISNVAGLLLFRLDLFFVGYFLSFKEVGVYSIALFSAEMITKIPYWSSSILTPMTASNEDGHIRKTVFLFYSSVILALVFGLTFVLIITVAPGFITGLIGKDYAGVETCLLLLLPRVIMQSGVGILAANLAGKGYPWCHPAGTIASAVCLIPLAIILIPIYGINGAALADSTAFIACFLIFWFGYQKHNNDYILAGFKPFLLYIFGKFWPINKGSQRV